LKRWNKQKYDEYYALSLRNLYLNNRDIFS
jgi:hypothetical protein